MMRCPPRHESGMDAITFAPVALIVQPQACVTQKRPLTNRIRRHFARIKAVGLDCGRSWLLRQKEAWKTSKDAPETLKTLRRRRRQRPGHSADESSEDSQTKVRKRRARRPGRPCRPPFHCRLPHECANDAPFPPRSPARRCDRPSGRSAPRG